MVVMMVEMVSVVPWHPKAPHHGGWEVRAFLEETTTTIIITRRELLLCRVRGRELVVM